MEKAILRDLGKLSDFYHNHNLLKLIYFPFDEKAGNNLMRFYTLQIINAMENLNRNHMVHFDLKPENLLISLNLIIKLSDFSLLRKINDNESIKIPGGTNGYLTMEYYDKKKISAENAYKQDVFSLGATLFFMKYGKLMLKYKKGEDNETNILIILEKLQFQISKILSDEFADKDFINLLVQLIAYKPEERPSFWQIYRNKWLYKDSKELESTFNIFENDEEKLVLELQKNDFLIEKKKITKKKPSKYKFKKIKQN
jgi:serine/threonine protein kinase